MSVLTFGADFSDLLHIITCPVVNGVRDSTLADDLVLAGRGGAKQCDIIYRFTQLSGSNAHPT